MDEKCFNHSDKDAIGVCHSCGRKFCSECMEKYNDKFFCYSDGCKFALKVYQSKEPVPKPEEEEKVQPAIIFPSIMKRFLNFGLDLIIINTILDLIFFNYEFDEQSMIQNPDPSIIIPLFLIQTIVIFCYFFIFEGLFQRTPAKFITNTLVIMRDGSKPGLKDIAIRTLCRFLPLEALSYKSGTWWHDRLSKTVVVIYNHGKNRTGHTKE